MSTQQFVTLLFLAILTFWAVGAINRLQRLRQTIVEAQPALAAQLQQRHEWATRMVGALRPLLPDESEALDRVQAACKQAGAALSLVQARPVVTGPLNSLALAENLFDDAVHPLLLRHEAFEGAQAWLQEWLTIQSQLSTVRQRFNEAVRLYNEARRQFPTRLIAALWGFRSAALLEAARLTTEPAAGGAPS
jgi:LemA protein